jgi:RimJ/RimL family protein N-acetyltransferase
MFELKPYSRDDFERLIVWAPTPEALMLWTGMVFTYPLTRDQLEKHLVFAEKYPERRKIWNATDGDTVVGHIELNNIWDHDRKATICRVLIDPAVRGKGLGKEMVKTVVRFGFEELSLHRIDLSAWSHNTAAIRCYEACGFTREGVQRDCRRMGDEWWDAVQMSILEHEWREC